MNQIGDKHAMTSSDGGEDAGRLIPLQLNPAQHRRLQWLVARMGPPTLWRSGDPLAQGCRLLVVLDAPTAWESEHILQSLANDATVAIPCSADPRYDAFKKELFAFGAIGPSPTSGPHMFWWGRNSSLAFAGSGSRGLPLIVSCYAPALTSFNKIRRLKLSVETLGLKHAVSQDHRISSWEHTGQARVKSIRDAWTSAECSILWVEPESILRELPLLPMTVGCDFAVYRSADGTFDGSALFFNHSSAGALLLNTWLRLCSDFPGVSDSRLLQQAWLVVTAQSDLETVWLPRTFCQNSQMLAPGDRPVVLAERRRRYFENAFGEDLPLADMDGSPEAPHAQFMAPGASAGANGPVVAILRSSEAANNDNPSGSIAAITASFACDPGGFSHLEIVVCRSEAAIAAAVDAAKGYWLVVADIGEPFASTAFKTFGESIRRGHVTGPPLQHSEPGGAQPSQQADCKPTSVKSSGVFLMKAPDARATAQPSLFLI